MAKGHHESKVLTPDESEAWLIQLGPAEHNCAAYPHNRAESCSVLGESQAFSDVASID